MGPIFVSILIACCFEMPARAARPRCARPIDRVGEVIIIGNTITQDRVIREVVTFLPGQILRYREIRRVERKLAELGLFKVDPKTGIRPTVQVLNSPGPFKDILIKVEEMPSATIRPLVQITPAAGLLLGFVIEERNFDPWRFPTSVGEFSDGRAFRGAGQKWRLEFGVAPLLQSRLPFSITARLTPFADGMELLTWRP